MSPLIEIDGITKHYGGLRPLRLRRLRVAAGDRLALTGLDAPAAETLVHLITGASVPDTGAVKVGGRDTRDIATDTEWLSSLDRFGIVTGRAVLLDALPIAANLALPMTLSIDPMSAATRAEVERLARSVQLTADRLDQLASTLTADELVRVHVARALATTPDLLLLEHPTAAVDDPAAREALGRMLAGIADAGGPGWLALTEDDAFVRGSRSKAARLTPATGELGEGGWWKKLWP